MVQRFLLLLTLALSVAMLSTFPFPAVAQDSDGDEVPDAIDNCSTAINSSSGNAQFDADRDGYGNFCDADFDQSNLVDSADQSILVSCFGHPVGTPGGPPADPDCSKSDLNGDGVVGGPDYSRLFQLFNQSPGPSGLTCAGSVPCCTPLPSNLILGYNPQLPTPAYSACGGPTIVVDHSHGNASTHRVSWQAQVNGPLVSGAYWAFGKLLTTDGFDVRDSDVPLTTLLPLRHDEILVILNPADELPPADISAVGNWVREGGSLFLIVDHHDENAAGDLLQDLLPGSDLRFDTPGGHGEAYSFAWPDPVLTAHIATMKPVQTFGGSAICPTTPLDNLDPCPPSGPPYAPLLAFPAGVMTTYGGVTTNLDGYLQGLAFPVGNGRVYFSGESAMFTRQMEFFPSFGPDWGMLAENANQQFLLNIVHWLDGIPAAPDH